MVAKLRRIQARWRRWGVQCSGLCNVPMGHGKKRPTQEIERDFRVRHPTSLQVRGTREENEGRRRTTGTREKRTKKKKTQTRTRHRQQRQQHHVAASIQNKGDQPPLKSMSERGSSHPVRETLRENGQQQMREREKKKNQKRNKERTSPIANLGVMGKGGGDVVLHMSWDVSTRT